MTDVSSPRMPAAGRGRVTLVGAGPGDPDLLTLKAARALRDADVVLVDDLVDRRVLDLVRPDVRVVWVGKRGGARSTPQPHIDRLMVDEVAAGRHVVRLKGGDPFLFGRGGEEAAHLRAAGIDVDVVPGITSGIAAPMVAGISVTHRDASPGVVFVTGHERDGDDERLDWAALVRCRLTLVVYMGISNAAKIERHLLEAGLDASTPVTAIQSATLPGERVLSTCVGGMANALAEAAIASPAILVIGNVARARMP
ncbi:MAG TPA: uroporphyrinogen-III C-methyltransferase [Burkholderiaceae bacterium]|nr:uroporphyrinogen-III C-methyltransferase [Burkholderiaceae bacterium]